MALPPCDSSIPIRLQRNATTMPAINRSDSNSRSDTPPASRRARRDETALQTPLETYLREINETALLSAQDEQELAGRIAD